VELNDLGEFLPAFVGAEEEGEVAVADVLPRVVVGSEDGEGLVVAELVAEVGFVDGGDEGGELGGDEVEGVPDVALYQRDDNRKRMRKLAPHYVLATVINSNIPAEPKHGQPPE